MSLLSTVGARLRDLSPCQLHVAAPNPREDDDASGNDDWDLSRKRLIAFLHTRVAWGRTRSKCAARPNFGSLAKYNTLFVYDKVALHVLGWR
jgi:hypothetical protein